MEFKGGEIVKGRNGGGKRSRIQKGSFEIHRGTGGTSGKAQSVVAVETEERCVYQVMDSRCLGLFVLLDRETAHGAALGS